MRNKIAINQPLVRIAIGYNARCSVTLLVFLLSLSIVLVGCGGDTSNTKTDKGKGENKKSQPETTVDVKLEAKNWAAVESWIKEQSGKVVVVDLWSTSCDPCMREFPHLVDLHNSMKDNVVCASVSLDYFGGSKKPEEYREVVTKFLKSRKATLTNFLSTDDTDAVLAKVEAPAIPICLIYNKEGKLSKMFHNGDDEYGDDGFTYADHIVPHIKKLLE